MKRSGLLDRIEAELERAEIVFKEWGGVKSNPRISFAEAACLLSGSPERCMCIWKSRHSLHNMEERCGGVQEEDDVAAAREGIRKTVEYFRELGMPVCLGELEAGVLAEEELVDMAERATGKDTFTVSKFRGLHIL